MVLVQILLSMSAGHFSAPQHPPVVVDVGQTTRCLRMKSRLSRSGLLDQQGPLSPRELNRALRLVSLQFVASPGVVDKAVRQKGAVLTAVCAPAMHLAVARRIAQTPLTKVQKRRFTHALYRALRRGSRLRSLNLVELAVQGQLLGLLTHHVRCVPKPLRQKVQVLRKDIDRFSERIRERGQSIPAFVRDRVRETQAAAPLMARLSSTMRGLYSFRRCKRKTASSNVSLRLQKAKRIRRWPSSLQTL